MKLKDFWPRNVEISLSHQFILYSSIIFFTILVCFSYFFVSQQSAENEAIVKKLSLETLSAKKSINDSIKYTELLVQNIANNIEEDPTNQNHINNVLRSFRNIHADKIKDILSISMFSWVDKDGKIKINSEFGFLKTYKDLSNRDYIPYTIKDPGKLYLGRPVEGGVSGQYIIPGGVGVADKNGNYQGTIAFGFNIESLYDKINSSKDFSNLEFLILHQIEVVKPTLDNEDGNRKFNYELPPIDLSKGDYQVFRELPFFGAGSVAIYERIDDTPYGIVLRLNDIKYLSESKINYLIELSIIFGSFIFFLIFLKKDFINPVLSLSKAAKSILVGEINKKIARSNIKEINQLAGTISMIQDFFSKEQEAKKQLNFAKQEAEKANLSKTTLLRSITHDLKNYIFGIYGLTNLILDKKTKEQINENEDLKLIQTVSSHSEELLHFVEDLLDTSHIEAGGFLLGKFEKCNVKDIINRMILLNKGLANRHQISIKSDIEDDLPELECDVKRLKQILTNLIINAIKYSFDGTVILITAKYLKNKKQICIEIADQGIGMAKKEIKMAFAGEGEKIEKLNLSKTVDSHGIGMTTVKKLMELHGGKIVINSDKGLGTKVKLYFNVAKKFSDSKNSDSVNKIKNKSVLLVEDNAVNIKVTSTILQNAGYKVLCAENGKEAIEMLDKHQFDLILMDGEMPIMDGYQTAATIREGECFKKFKNYKTIPIIALMAGTDDETVSRAINSGMNYHMGKSSSKKELLDMIKNCL